MKKSLQIPAHLTLWILFTLMVIAQAKLFLETNPNAPFGQNFTYVIFLEIIMAVIFFYVTFFALPWARRSTANGFILGTVLLLLLVIFAYPAMKIGAWQVISSVVPHLALIFLAVGRKESVTHNHTCSCPFLPAGLIFYSGIPCEPDCGSELCDTSNNTGFPLSGVQEVFRCPAFRRRKKGNAVSENTD